MSYGLSFREDEVSSYPFPRLLVLSKEGSLGLLLVLENPPDVCIVESSLLFSFLVSCWKVLLLSEVLPLLPDFLILLCPLS